MKFAQKTRAFGESRKEKNHLFDNSAKCGCTSCSKLETCDAVCGEEVDLILRQPVVAGDWRECAVPGRI
jgi:hypothetical protein